MTKQFLKTYSLRLKTTKDVDKLTEFQKAAVYNGVSVSELVKSLMSDYVASSKPPFKVVTETELLSEATRRGISVNGASLKKYRSLGVLRDNDGEWIFKNPDGNIVYRLDKMLKYLKMRSENKYSRIIRRDNGKK